MSLSISNIGKRRHNSIFHWFAGISGESTFELDFINNKVIDPPLPICKSLWTTSVETAAEYCRIVWDLFPAGKLACIHHRLNDIHKIINCPFVVTLSLADTIRGKRCKRSHCEHMVKQHTESDARDERHGNGRRAAEYSTIERLFGHSWTACGC